MRLAFVCSGKPDNLQYLVNNRTMVDELLTQHGWKVIQTPLYSIADLNRRLQEYQKSNIDEFLFFYTGHGDVSNRQQILKLQLDNTEISLNDVLDSIFKYINPKKQAIVLDACYSGTLKDLTLEKNTEFLFSSQAREQSYEDDALEASVFSFYFCEAVENGYVKLKDISAYIASRDERQNPLPMRVGSEFIAISTNKSNKIYSSMGVVKKKKSVLKKYLLAFISILFIGLFLWKSDFLTSPKKIVKKETQKIVQEQKSEKKEDTLTKILLEDRIKDKKKDEKIAFLERKIAILKRQIIDNVEESKAQKILYEADKIYTSKGPKYTINFLKVTLKKIKRLDNKLTTDKNNTRNSITIQNSNHLIEPKPTLSTSSQEKSDITQSHCEFFIEDSLLTFYCNTEEKDINIKSYQELNQTVLEYIAKTSFRINDIEIRLFVFEKVLSILEELDNLIIQEIEIRSQYYNDFPKKKSSLFKKIKLIKENKDYISYQINKIDELGIKSFIYLLINDPLLSSKMQSYKYCVDLNDKFTIFTRSSKRYLPTSFQTYRLKSCLTEFKTLYKPFNFYIFLLNLDLIENEHNQQTFKDFFDLYQIEPSSENINAIKEYVENLPSELTFSEIALKIDEYLLKKQKLNQ